ncbi:type I 3-dehydroquinate dehydratase [Brucepastera parasyntrophica]|uniref:type I 3-dehydroquinate dehydratase n=1 Tax=Brucepastera parasyntrophica TaxID=2880008 RepID=UPI00210A3FCB|nr:type I 3-dehydroquinate dehydratase [Brucepastera parasyntrophica]ULQ60954.1 type I 3-dehydroquinate dehydratase [Brucepastera parasyntrophica]
MRTKICLVLTEPSLKEDLALVEQYRQFIDMVELRADCLLPEERIHFRHFPEMAKLPCILTVRRKSDGGRFLEGEGSRTTIFAQGLAFADTDPKKNFAYIDLEEDLELPSIEEAARAFGTKIIRSVHNMNGPLTGIPQMVKRLRRTKDEIAKIAFMPRNLSDVTQLFREAKKCYGEEYTLLAMGPYGLPSRILASHLGSCITYVLAPSKSGQENSLGQLDPVSINEIYHIRQNTSETKIFGVTGNPLSATLSPQIHNSGYVRQHIDAVYVPLRAESIEEAISFAEETDIPGLSVTFPFKETVLPNLDQISAEAGEIGACNTIIKTEGAWQGYNTDAKGFERALLGFLNRKDLKKLRVSIIGAGGVARAVAHAVKEMKGKACIFNRTPEKARDLARLYNFKWAVLDAGSRSILESYSDVIIQTTNVGMSPQPDEDPIDFYAFSGSEAVYDVIYHPEKTRMLRRAEHAGCRISNGYSMLQYQAYLQYKLFTGIDYENN